MGWVILGLIVLGVIVICVAVYFLYRKKLDGDEKRLVRFLKKNGGEVNPRWVKDEMGVDREWLEDVASRLEEKGLVIRWGWQKKSLICLKRVSVKREKKVVKLLRKNGAMLEEEVALKLKFTKEYFYHRVVRKLEEKGIVYRRTRGKSNLLVLVGKKDRISSAARGTPSKVGTSKKVPLSSGEVRLVKILRKNGGEMLDRGIVLRMRDGGDVIDSLIRKGVVFRWGTSKKNVCLKGFLNEREEGVVKVLRDSGGEMLWRDLVKGSGYCGNNFYLVLDKLEMKGFIIRRKKGRDFEIVLV